MANQLPAATDSIASTPESDLVWYKALLQPQIGIMLLLGFSAGIPILLIFSSLSLWLGEAGVERKAVTFFSWAALGYSFKFVWAPLVDCLPIPYLTRAMGRRRSWLLVSQLLIMLAILLMASIDPALGQEHLVWMAWAAVLLGFSSATQDIVIDAYRIEVAETRLQALMSSAYIAGYRVGMVVAGAGALWLAASLGSKKGEYLYSAWQWTYVAMAAVMLVGVATTLWIREPAPKQASVQAYSTWDYLRLVLVFGLAVSGFVGTFFIAAGAFDYLGALTDGGPLAGFLVESLRFITAILVAVLVGWVLVRLNAVNRGMAHSSWVAPIAEFFQRYGVKTALLLLALIGLYRISDIVAGVSSNVFYQDLGFSKEEIATAVKTFGVIVSIAGGFLGGIFASWLGVIRALLLGGLLAALSNLVFVWLAYSGKDLLIMYLAITADNLAAGFASAAFVAFLSALTNVSFTAVQYAIFSSLMTLIPKVIGGYAGTIIDAMGYPWFFSFTTLIGIPVLFLVLLVQRYVKVE